MMMKQITHKKCKIGVVYITQKAGASPLYLTPPHLEGPL